MVLSNTLYLLIRQESIRSIIISQRILGTRTIMLFHHTDCGLQTFTTPELCQQIKDAAPGDISVSQAADEMDLLEFSDLEESVRSNVKFIREHPLVLPETVVTGWVYDVKTGKVCRMFGFLHFQQADKIPDRLIL